MPAASLRFLLSSARTGKLTSLFEFRNTKWTFPFTAPNAMPASTEVSAASAVLKFAKLSESARTPTKGSVNAAGYDLYSAVDEVVPARGKSIVPTDIQIAVPDGCYGRVAPRSGLAAKSFIDVGAGVIDHDYRGNVGVIMFNFSDKDFPVKKGDRIAQLICEKIFYPDLEELPTLTKTERGSKGYGSTGVN